MTLDQAQEAGRLSAVLEELRSKFSAVVQMPADTDLGIDVTYGHENGCNECVGSPPLMVGKHLVIATLELLEQQLVSRLRALGVEP